MAIAVHDRYLGLLDQDIHGSNTSSITTRHPIDLIHDQARPGVDIQSRRRIMLLLPQNVQHSIKARKGIRLTEIPPPSNQPSSEALSMFVAFYDRQRSIRRRRLANETVKITWINFLLRASEAFNSMGEYPFNRATRCADVVFPMPGGPLIRMARKAPDPSLPGFLKPLLYDLGLLSG